MCASVNSRRNPWPFISLRSSKRSQFRITSSYFNSVSRIIEKTSRPTSELDDPMLGIAALLAIVQSIQQSDGAYFLAVLKEPKNFP